MPGRYDGNMPRYIGTPNRLFSFIAACCTANRNDTAWLHDVHAAYDAWRIANRAEPIAKNAFGVMLRKHFRCERSTDGYIRVYGLAVKNEGRMEGGKRLRINTKERTPGVCVLCGSGVFYRLGKDVLCSRCHPPSSQEQVEYVITEVI